MLRNFFTFSALLLMCGNVFAQSNMVSIGSANVNYPNNRFPLVQKPYIELPLGTIKPRGWMQDQMERMVNGMTGNLDELYVAVMGERNGWLGGDGDVWERGPYWIDGLLPLAYILDNKAMKDKVQPWIEWTLASQKPNGYFGPDVDRDPEFGLQRNNSHDWWPKMVMLKVMKQYYEATRDQRVIPFLTNYFKYQLKELPNTPLNNWTFWGQQRGGDNLMVVYWLYNITGDKFLLDLAQIIHAQTYNWTDVFLNQSLVTRELSMHTVNLAQGMKEPVIFYQQNKDPKQIASVKRAFEDIRKSIGWPTGLYGADELLRKGSPTEGSELCTAVEMMFSLENMLQITGDTQWANLLERVTFNALPTQITDDFSARQYYQQLNQVMITRHDRDFITCYNGTDQLFGLLTGYPCCTSNLHQGWPKFVQNLWYATEDNGVAALVYAASEVTMKVANGIEVNIVESTDYPFENTVRFKVNFTDKKLKTGVMFPFHLRIPDWCEEAVIRVNGAEWGRGASDQIAKVVREWKSGDEVTIEMPMQVSISRWYSRSAVVERGPLVYALRIGEKWEKVQDDKKYGTRYGDFYWEVTPTSPWNYCLLEANTVQEKIAEAFAVSEKPLNGKYPWNLENAPIEIKTTGRRMKNWQIYNQSAGLIPFSPQYQAELEAEEEITLIPYGCTTLRITEFPTTR